MTTVTIAATSLDGDERWRLVQRMLASPVFAGVPRMRALLSFLMVRKIADMEETISERAIAAEVFRRDALTHDPAVDPVVARQMDRLRERLAQYYALYEPAAPWQVTIPGDNLVPVIVHEPRDRPARRVTIALDSLRTGSLENGRARNLRPCTRSPAPRAGRAR